MQYPADLISAPAAARLLGISARSVGNWVRRGVITGYWDPVARRLLIPAAEVDRLAPHRRLLPLTKVEAPSHDPASPGA